MQMLLIEHWAPKSAQWLNRNIFAVNGKELDCFRFFSHPLKPIELQPNIMNGQQLFQTAAKNKFVKEKKQKLSFWNYSK